MTAREQPLAVFLQDLFSGQDMPVVVSPALNSKINGDFTGPAEEVYSQIARAYGLVAHFDGTVLHIYPASEVTTKTLSMDKAVSSKVVGTALQLKLTNPQNTMRSTPDGALLVTGTPRFVEQMEELAKAQQAAQSSTPSSLGVRVFPLRYAWAQDVSVSFGGRVMTVPGVASTVRAMMATSGRSQLQAMPQEIWLRPTVPGLRGQGLGGNSGAMTANAPGGVGGEVAPGSAATVATAWGQQNPGINGGGGNGPAAGQLAVQAPAQPMPSVAEGGLARVEADPRLNAVIVRDAPSRMRQYEALIASLDLEPATLEIEATIIDIDTEKARDLGINWRFTRGRGSALFGSGPDSGRQSDRLLQGSVPSGNVTPEGKGGFLSAVLGDTQQFVARINAMEEQGAAKVVSSPQVVTLSNVEAVFDSSKTFYVRVAGREQVDLFNVSAGTMLRVTPHVFKEQSQNRIKLLVQIDDGEVTQEQVDQIPVVDRSAINTQAMIFEGESLLLGGLTKERSSQGVTKVPLLGDIPVLGNLFKYSHTETGRKERMFLISPRLAVARRPALAAATPTGTSGSASNTGGSAAAAVPVAASGPVLMPLPEDDKVVPHSLRRQSLQE